MAIYTRRGARVDFLSAQFLPVWIEREEGLCEEPVWHVTARYEDGRSVVDGKPVSVGGFVADGGMHEIIAECHRLNPEHAAKFGEWIKAGRPKASELFPCT